MDWLDILTTILGLLYIWLEYRASIALWVVGIIMPALDIFLYWSHGLYGDAGMATYYTFAAVYGLIAWRYSAWKVSRASSRQPSSSSSQQLSGGSSQQLSGGSSQQLSGGSSQQLSGGSSQQLSGGSSQCDELPLPSPLPITHMPVRLYLPSALFFIAAWAVTYYVLTTWTNSTVPLLDAFTNALSFIGLWALARKYVEQWFFWIIVDIVCCYLYIGKGIPFKAALYGLYVVIAIAGYFKWKQMMKNED